MKAKLTALALIASTLLVGCGESKEQTFYKRWRQSHEDFITNVREDELMTDGFYNSNPTILAIRRRNIHYLTPDKFTHKFIYKYCAKTMWDIKKEANKEEAIWENIDMKKAFKYYKRPGKRARERGEMGNEARLAYHLVVEAKSLSKACSKYI